MNSIGSRCGPVEGFCEHVNESSGSTRGEKFLVQRLSASKEGNGFIRPCS